MAQVLSAYLPAQAAAGATLTVPIGIVSSDQGTDNYVRGVRAVSSATVTGVTTNTVTLNVRVVRAGAAAFTIATLPLVTGTNITAETPVSFTQTETQAQQSSLADGDIIDVQLVQAGTGLAINASQVLVQADLS